MRRELAQEEMRAEVTMEEVASTRAVHLRSIAEYCYLVSHLDRMDAKIAREAVAYLVA